MNTDRDNFHDWARDKEDTSFSELQRADFGVVLRRRRTPWGRYLGAFVLAAAGIMALRFFG